MSYSTITKPFEGELDMAKENYLTDLELAETALRRAHEDPLWAELTDKTPLDYFGPSYFVKTEKPKPIPHCNFDVVGHAVYGGNEGVYAHIYMVPDPRPASLPTGEILLLKTLGASKQDYLNMQQVAGLLAYHAIRTIDDNIDRFD